MSLLYKLTYKEASIRALRESSYSRMQRILNMRCVMQETTWFKLLGSFWSMCDNISEHDHDIRAMLKGRSHVHQMMTASELRVLCDLPEKVTIYRGCGERNVKGLCWSTNRAVAVKFPFKWRYRTADPLLATAEVFKRDIVAFKSDRKESEIITLKPRMVRLEPLEATP